MKLDERRLFDQLLTAEGPCIGAAFCSYTFDPAYFEEHVLRTVLRLESDPEEDARRYHEEARKALQGTPIACIVDAGQRAPGRRLPYDVHLVRNVTFHPKVYLVLFESEARLAIGSGNLTKPGIEQNTELFFMRRLAYDDVDGAEILRGVDDLLRESVVLSGTPGTQLAMVRETLQSRIRKTPRRGKDETAEIRFVSSFSASLLSQLGESIHEHAKITAVSVLCPFFERDDVGVGDPEQGLRGLLADLLKLRPSRDAVLHVGVPWDDAPLAPSVTEIVPRLEDSIGRLWVRRQRSAEGADSLEYFVIQSVSAKRIEATTAAGEPRRLERGELEAEIADGRLWTAARPTVHAPERILRRIAAEQPVQLWLHPTSDLGPGGRRRRRPLHAKIVLVTAVYRNKTFTHALIGSANASHAALGRTVATGGNVEAGILCRFDGEVGLRDLLPTLVRFPLENVTLAERTFPTAPVDLSVCIESAVHDASARTLTVTWNADAGVEPGRWMLRYVRRDLAAGDTLPITPTVVDDFDLDAASAELTFEAAGREWEIPILVLNLAMLPTNPHLSGLGLRELLALLGRRVGGERLATMREQRGAAGVASALDAVFGEGFGPTDVFGAWWGAVEDLAAASTVAAFRSRLQGSTGVLAAWKLLCGVAGSHLSKDEIWVYGCELLKELGGIELPPGPDTKAKKQLLSEAIATVRAGVDAAAPSEAEHKWLAIVAKFYGVGGSDVRA